MTDHPIVDALAARASRLAQSSGPLPHLWPELDS